MNKPFNSAAYAASLAMGLPMEALPLNDRSDLWWDKFWYYYGLNESQRILESTI